MVWRRFTRQDFGIRNRASWWKVFGHALHHFHEHDLFTPAAAMSYFALLTLFPLLLVVLAIGNKLPSGSDLIGRIASVYPGSGDFLETTIRSLENVSTGVVLSCAVVMLWAGSWVFAVLERAVNRVWGTRPRTFFHGRALTLVMLFILGGLLAISVFSTSALVALQNLADSLPLGVLERVSFLTTVQSAFWQLVFTLVSTAVTIFTFVLVYRLVPSGRVQTRDVLPSAILAGISWEIAKYIFARSLHFFHYDQIYGSVGTVVAVLTWSYVSSLILLFGAQLSATLHDDRPTTSDIHEAVETATEADTV